jgi:hypothetical protein
VLEVHVDRINELLAIEKRADGNLHAGDAALELKHFDLVGKRLAVSLEDADHILAVFLVADEQAPLDVAGCARRLDDIAFRIALHVRDRVVEVVEFAVRQDVDARLSELFLAEGTIVLQAVRIRRAAHDKLALAAQGLRLRALTKRVVEYNDVRPRDLALPIVDLGHEAVGDIAFLGVLDEILDRVTLFGDLPGMINPDSDTKRKLRLSSFMDRPMATG